MSDFKSKIAIIHVVSSFLTPDLEPAIDTIKSYPYNGTQKIGFWVWVYGPTLF